MKDQRTGVWRATARSLMLFVCALALTAVTVRLGAFVLIALVGMFLDSLRYGQIIGGGMVDGFPFLLAVAVFILAKWSYATWLAWNRLRRPLG